MASSIDAMQRYEKIMLRCAWAMLHRCLQCSTTRSLDCSPNKGRPISLMPDAHSPIISTKHSLLWWLKEEMRLCNSPVDLFHKVGNIRYTGNHRGADKNYACS